MSNLLHRISEFFCKRQVAATFLAFSMAFCIYKLTDMTKAVYIRDNNETILQFTTKHDTNSILSEEGISTNYIDVIDSSGLDEKIAYINITRAFPVTISVDKQEIPLMITDGTVEDILFQNDIELGEKDLINLPINKTLSPDDRIEITRISSDEFVETEVIPHNVVYKETCLLKNNKTRVLKKGMDGEKQYIYKREYTDGEISSEEIIDESIIKNPKDEIILVGKSGTPISDLDFGYTLDENGIPENYTKVLHNQVATGYSAGGRARGASGMRLFYGYVATDPEEIPYGTHMYITSPDGSFVYGYAIAADTGIGLLDDVIDVDLFYETYLESCLNGRQNVDIYILD